MTTFQKLFESTKWIVTDGETVYAANLEHIKKDAVLKGAKRNTKDYEGYVWDTENDARFIMNQAITHNKKLKSKLKLEQIPV